MPKKPFQSKLQLIAAQVLIVATLICGIAFTNQSASAATAEELQAKIDQQKQLIQQIDEKIKEYSDLTDKTTKEAKSLSDVITQLKQNQRALELDISKTTLEINKTSLDIQNLDVKITSSKEKIDNYKNAIESSVKEINQNESSSIIVTFLSKKSLSEILNQIDQQKQFNSKLSSSIEALTTEKQKLEVSQESKIAAKDDLEKYKKELSDKKKVIEYNKTEQTKALQLAENKKKTYQQILAEQQATKNAFEQDLFNYESQLKFTLDPSTLPPKNSSVLSWPVSKVIITQMFGKTSASGRLYVSGSHNGVDFGAKIGTPVMALADGVVGGTGDTDLTCPHASFGRWVFIKFDNGLSVTYGHLSVISAQQGQRVKTGDIIGYSGNTGYSTGPHVHISIYASNAVSVQQRPSAACGGRVYTMPIAPVDAYLDPMLYFPAYKG